MTTKRKHQFHKITQIAQANTRDLELPTDQMRNYWRLRQIVPLTWRAEVHLDSVVPIPHTEVDTLVTIDLVVTGTTGAMVAQLWSSWVTITLATATTTHKMKSARTWLVTSVVSMGHARLMLIARKSLPHQLLDLSSSSLWLHAAVAAASLLPNASDIHICIRTEISIMLVSIHTHLIHPTTVTTMCIRTPLWCHLQMLVNPLCTTTNHPKEDIQ